MKRRLPRSRVAIALGSNLGSRLAYLRAAVDALEAAPGLGVLALSRVYETAPVGPPQPDYLNAVVLVEADASLERVFETCRSVEEALGRTRGERWGPRHVDLDLVLADAPALSTPDLRVPHPEAAGRPFVLAPLVDVWPDARLEGRPATDHLAERGGAPARVQPFARDADVVALDHTADVALRITAGDEADLLAAAGDALVDVILDRQRVRGVSRTDVTIEGDDVEERIVALQSEVLARFEVDGIAPRRTLVRAIDGPRVDASLWGEPFDASRHAPRTAVKAVTFHGLRVERVGDGLGCTVVLDL